VDATAKNRDDVMGVVPVPPWTRPGCSVRGAQSLSFF
jgi:hypothetical protein